MAGPARAGLFIYAVDVARLVAFYEAVAGMRVTHTSVELAVLESPDLQMLVHRIPPEFAADIEITSPPQRREDTALKLFLSVPTLRDASEAARRLGGEMFEERWEGPGFIACNAMDPAGNVFQLREWTA